MRPPCHSTLRLRFGGRKWIDLMGGLFLRPTSRGSIGPTLGGVSGGGIGTSRRSEVFP